MTHRSTGIGRSLDAFFAFCIALIALLSATHVPLGLRHIAILRISILDTAFIAFLAFAWRYFLDLGHVYARHEKILTRLVSIGKAALMMALLLTVYLKIFHTGSSTFYAVVLLTLSAFLYQSSRIAVSEWLASREALKSPRRVLILGSGRRAGKAWRELRTRHHRQFELLGFVDDRDPRDMAPDVVSHFRGRVDQLSQILLSDVVDVLVVAMPMQSCYSLTQRAISVAEEVGVRVLYLEDVYATRRRDDGLQRGLFRELGAQHDQHLLRLAIKRGIDITGAALGLLVLSPVLLCIAIGVKLDSPGPVLFNQERYGFQRRRFRMLKFRSMVQNAEQLMKHLESSNEADGPIFKMQNDPRVTRFGRFLRTSSLDELPQLWNVFTGEMSLVGPRPMSVRDVSLFGEASLMRRFSVKPGITGLWQVNGRSAVSFEKWIEWDCDYIDRWSLLLDLRILFRTFSTVVRRSGAM